MKGRLTNRNNTGVGMISLAADAGEIISSVTAGM